MIDQLTVFLENSEGRLAALCRVLADAKVNMYALTIADTTDYGIVRIICDDPEKAVNALSEQDYRAVRARIDPEADPFLWAASEHEKGIRILRQDSWETQHCKTRYRA